MKEKINYHQYLKSRKSWAIFCYSFYFSLVIMVIIAFGIIFNSFLWFKDVIINYNFPILILLFLFFVFTLIFLLAFRQKFKFYVIASALSTNSLFANFRLWITGYSKELNNYELEVLNDNDLQNNSLNQQEKKIIKRGKFLISITYLIFIIAICTVCYFSFSMFFWLLATNQKNSTILKLLPTILIALIPILAVLFRLAIYLIYKPILKIKFLKHQNLSAMERIFINNTRFLVVINIEKWSQELNYKIENVRLFDLQF